MKYMSQDNTRPYMRIARIVVDSALLESYRDALKEGITAAVEKEPGVLSLSAVYEKDHPRRSARTGGHRENNT